MDRQRILPLIGLYICATLYCGCCRKELGQSVYCSIPPKGWSKTDTLQWELIPPPSYAEQDATLSLQLRTDNYPYANIAIEYYVYSDTALLLSGNHQFILSDPTNTSKYSFGRRYDYTLPIGDICGTDTVTIAIRHLMADEFLPGIHEAGINIKHLQTTQWKVKW